MDLPTPDRRSSITTKPGDHLVQRPSNSTINRAEIPLPDEPDADAFDGEPLPESWMDVGEHWETTAGEARLFAVSVTTDAENGALYVRYIHPSNKAASILEFEAIEIDSGGLVPLPAYKTHILDEDEIPDKAATFPLSFGVGGLTTVSDDDAPTHAERQFIWARYGDFLKAETLYLPPTFAEQPETA
jgi:hypothetical protein